MFNFFKKDSQNKPLAIIGLGNPGSTYEQTRHNVGFMAIDEIALDEGFINFQKVKKIYLQAETKLANKKTLLLKPQTFMNLSGKAVQSAMTKHSLKKEDILIIYDDITLPVGQIRIRKKGSSGGHNGIKSIIEVMGQEFPRIRIGIKGANYNKELVDYVLGNFSAEERETINASIQKIPEILKTIVTKGIDKAMNEFN